MTVRIRRVQLRRGVARALRGSPATPRAAARRATAGAISPSSAPPCSSRSTARSVITMPPVGRRRPRRPPVHDRRSQAGFLGDLPERLDSALVAARDRRPRQAHADRSRRRRRARGAGARGETCPAARRRAASRWRARRGRRVGRRWRSSSTRARDRTCPAAADATRACPDEPRPAAIAAKRVEHRRVEAVDRDQTRRRAVRHDGQRRMIRGAGESVPTAPSPPAAPRRPRTPARRRRSRPATTCRRPAAASRRRRAAAKNRERRDPHRVAEQQADARRRPRARTPSRPARSSRSRRWRCATRTSGRRRQPIAMIQPAARDDDARARREAMRLVTRDQRRRPR